MDSRMVSDPHGGGGTLISSPLGVAHAMHNPHVFQQHTGEGDGLEESEAFAAPSLKRHNLNVTPLQVKSSFQADLKSPSTVQGVEALTSLLHSTTLNDALAHLSTTTHVSRGIPSSKGIGDYTFIKDLGEGTTGKVRLAMHTHSRQQFAIKCVQKRHITGMASAERLVREILFVKLLEHPNIARLFELIDTPTEIFMVLEYASGGELFDYIVHHQRVKEKEARRFFRQIISALQYCHANMVIHRDLKPENLLLDEKLNIKIIDFGFANVTKPGLLLETFCGSPAYAAPEMIAGHKYMGAEVDIWSIGVILYALLCGYLPFDDENNARLYKLILEAKYTFPDFVSDGAKDLISRLLRINPKDRLTLDQVQQHPWVNAGYSSPVAFFQPSIIPDGGSLPEDAVLQELMAIGFSDAEIQAALAAPTEHPQVVAAIRLLQERRRQRTASESNQEAAHESGAFLDPRANGALAASGSSSSISSFEVADGAMDHDALVASIDPRLLPPLPSPRARADSFSPRMGSLPGLSPTSHHLQVQQQQLQHLQQQQLQLQQLSQQQQRRTARRTKRGSDAGFPFSMTKEAQVRLNSISENNEICEFAEARASGFHPGMQDIPADAQQYIKARGRRHSEQPTLAGHNFPLLGNVTVVRRRSRGNLGIMPGFASEVGHAPYPPVHTHPAPYSSLPSQHHPLFSSVPLLFGHSAGGATAPTPGGLHQRAHTDYNGIDPTFAFPTQVQTAPTTPNGALSNMVMFSPTVSPQAVATQQLASQQQQMMEYIKQHQHQVQQQQQLNQAHMQHQQHFQQQQQQQHERSPAPLHFQAHRRASVDWPSDSSSDTSVPAPLSASSINSSSNEDHLNSNSPRSVRGLFNMETTSTKHPLVVTQEIIRVLTALGFSFINSTTFFFQVETPYGGDLVRLELEVCVLARIELTGIRIKRLGGNIWSYKAVCGPILAGLQL